MVIEHEHVEGYRQGLFFFVYYSAVIKYVGCIDVGMLKVLHHEGHWTGLVVGIFNMLKASSRLLLSIKMDHKTIDKPARNLPLHVL